MSKTRVKTPFFSAERKSRLFLSILVSVALSLVILVVAPLDMFGNNLEELNFSFSDFAPRMALYALGNSLVLFCILFLIPRRGYRVMLALFIATGFLLVIQQNFLNFEMTSLPGDNIASELPIWQIVIDTVVWIGGYALAIYLVRRKDENGRIKFTARVLAFMLFAMEIVSAVSIILSHTDLFTPKIERTEQNFSTLTVKNYNDISSGRNIFYFVVDRFDEQYAEDAYNDDHALFDDLNGFTWYQDHIANYGHTFPGVANMLTNKVYTAASSRAKYLDSAYDGGIPLKILNDNGYNINLYTQAYYAFTEAQKLPDYVQNIGAVRKVDTVLKKEISLKMTYFSLYRGLPLVFKKFLTVGSTGELNSLIIFGGEIDGTTYNGYDGDTRKAYRAMAKPGDFTDSDSDKQFTFIHFDGCHNSYYDEQWGTSGDTSIVISVRNSFQIIKGYIQALKDKGVYDDSTIIITGDHSYAHDDFKNIREPRLTALFVKKAGETGAFRTSMAQTSHKDIWATIFESENLDKNLLADISNPALDGEGYRTSVFDAETMGDRTRTMIWHTYSLDCDEYFYTITGAGRTYPSNWRQDKHIHYNKFVMN